MFSIRGAARAARTLCVAIVAVALAGCVTTPGVGAAPGEPTITSALLSTELGVAVDEAVYHAVQRGRLDVADAETAAFVESVRQTMLAQYEHALQVTPNQERAFRTGAYATERNAARLGQMLQRFQDEQIPMNTVETYFAERFIDGDLGGARLELATRIVQAHYDAILMGELLGSF